jgi:hypothetical protein
VNSINAILSFGIDVSKLAVMAIILYYVCEFLPIPANPKRICQVLIILIAIFAAIQDAMASSPSPTSGRRLSDPMGGVPSIIAPERH